MDEIWGHSKEDAETLFTSERNSGWTWQHLPAVFFILHGFDVYVDSLPEDTSVETAYKYEDTVDLWVKGYPIEVKAVRAFFTCVSDFPFPGVFGDTVSSYQKRTTKPVAYISLCRHTGAMITFFHKYREHWEVKPAFDTVRRITEDFYRCPKLHVHPISKLVEILKKAPHQPIPDNISVKKLHIGHS